MALTIRINMHGVEPVFFATELCGYVTGVACIMAQDSHPMRWWNIDALLVAAGVGLFATMVPCFIYACLCMFVARRMGLLGSLAVSLGFVLCIGGGGLLVFWRGHVSYVVHFLAISWPCLAISGLVGMYVAWRHRDCK